MNIDFVITWVDGSDSEWLAERDKFMKSSLTSKRQFRDWDILKYWFRGVEKYAPWVNKIYFITWGHVPDFLNVNHPKIEIVNHRDYLPSNYRPTFNSNAIELSMHKIKGLSETFVYFNDDMFIVESVSENDFFYKSLPRDVAILNPIVAKDTNTIASIMLNNMGVINKHFNLRESVKRSPFKWFNLKYSHLLSLNFIFQPWNKAVGLYQQHLPSSFLKSTFENVWAKEFKELDETSKRKFRNNKLDVNQWLFKEWQVMNGNFHPRKISFGKYIMVKNSGDVDTVNKYLHDRKTKVICINDHVDNGVEEVSLAVKNSLEKKFKEKSSFEV